MEPYVVYAAVWPDEGDNKCRGEHPAIKAGKQALKWVSPMSSNGQMDGNVNDVLRGAFFVKVMSYSRQGVLDLRYIKVNHGYSDEDPYFSTVQDATGQSFRILQYIEALPQQARKDYLRTIRHYINMKAGVQA